MTTQSSPSTKEGLDNPPAMELVQNRLTDYSRLWQLICQRDVDIAYVLSFICLAVLLVAPLWTVTYLPLGDLPDHAAQIRALLNFDQYANDYRINWATPYWLGYGLTMLFAQLVSVVVAMKIVLSLALLGVPLAGVWLLRAVGGNRFWVWSMFPIAYGFAFFWGFFNFIVAIPIAVAFLAFTVSYAKAQGGWKAGRRAAAMSLLLLLAHGLAWLFAVLIAFAIILMHNSWRIATKKASIYLLVLPLALLIQTLFSDGSGPGIEPGHYIEHYVDRIWEQLSYIGHDIAIRGDGDPHWAMQRMKEFFSYAIGKEPLWDYIVLALLVAFWPLLTGARLQRHWRHWLPLLAALSVYMLVPYWILGTAYVYMRASVFLIPACYFLFDNATPPSSAGLRYLYRRRLLTTFAFILVALVLHSNYSLMASFAQEDKDFKAILSRMEPGRQVMALIVDHDSALPFAPAYMFQARWYQAEKLGDVVPNFPNSEDAANVPLRFRNTPKPYPDAWNALEFDWYVHKGYGYDYFIVRAGRARPDLFKQVDGRVGLIARQGEWLLYQQRRDKPRITYRPIESPE